MGGRGANSGMGKHPYGSEYESKRAKAKYPAYFGETEKAVRLKLEVHDYDLEGTKQRIVYVPKSQLSADGIPGEWITGQKAQEFYRFDRSRTQYSATWIDANGKRYESGQTAREKEQTARRQNAIAKGAESYNALLAEAKSLGIKGIRKGMKRKTIQAKIDEYKSRS